MKKVLTSEDVSYLLELVKEDPITGDLFYDDLKDKLRTATSVTADVDNLIKKYE